MADYGNKLGVPTVAGAVLFDPGYVANPLVFCGCVGRVHRGTVSSPQPGDRVLVIGALLYASGLVLMGLSTSGAAFVGSTGLLPGSGFVAPALVGTVAGAGEG